MGFKPIILRFLYLFFWFFSNGVIKEEQPESTCANSDMPLDRILEAQTKSEKAGENPGKSFSQNYQCANVIC